MEGALPQVEQRVDSMKSKIAPQLSIGAWIITFLLLSIPLVNIILLFVWAFDAKSERRNFSRAYLIIMCIMFALTITFTIIAIALGASSGIFNFTE